MAKNKAAMSGMKQALREENQAFENRFAKAESLLTGGVEVEQEAPAIQKVIRDNITILKSDAELLDQLERRLMRQEVKTTKSAIFRVGLKALEQMGDAELIELVQSLEIVKPGRPKKI